MSHSKWLHGRICTDIKEKTFFEVSSNVEIKRTEHSKPLDQKEWKSALFQKKSPDPLPNRCICRGEFLAIIWNFWRYLLVYRVISMANLYGYLQLPPAQLHQFKAAGIGSPAAGVIFWQSHEPSSSQQFYTRCLYKHGTILPSMCAWPGTQLQNRLLTFTYNPSRKKSCGNPGFRSEIKHSRKIFMYRIIFQRESADP